MHQVRSQLRLQRVRLNNIIKSENKAKMKSNYGLIHIYTGDGKGKTSAVVGLAARVLGAGDTVLFAQLFKHESSELASLRKLGATILQYSHQSSFTQGCIKRDLFS